MKKVRYAVVGLGNITQSMVLPGFKNSPRSELVALITGDKAKLKLLAKRYQVEQTYNYEQYDECLKSGDIDAVYIGLPNHLHCEYTVRAAAAGVHVLCEKPMAVNEEECQEMIAACEKGRTKLMIAYRLHFEEGSLEAVRLATSGKLGDARIFNASFCQQVAPGNVRIEETERSGGGSLYDMGVYCINAARYLFRDEPFEVIATSASSTDKRFRATEEMTTAILRFPGERLATITSSFGAAAFSEYSLIGTRGWLRYSPAFDFHKPIRCEVMLNGNGPKRRQFKRSDQFGAELAYFSDCILKNRQPEPSGREGQADVRIICAILEAARTQGPIRLSPFQKLRRPTKGQGIRMQPIAEPAAVHAPGPTQ